jgi:hypothetical protein
MSQIDLPKFYKPISERELIILDEIEEKYGVEIANEMREASVLARIASVIIGNDYLGPRETTWGPDFAQTYYNVLRRFCPEPVAGCMQVFSRMRGANKYGERDDIENARLARAWALGIKDVD